MAFPVGFGWGAATAAYQIEGRRRCFSLVGAGMDASGGFCNPGEEGGVLNRQKQKKDAKHIINETVVFRQKRPQFLSPSSNRRSGG